jgi:hypothetical protein
MQFVSETLAPSSLFDIFRVFCFGQSRVNHTVSHTGAAPQTRILSLSLSPCPTAAAGLAIGGLRICSFTATFYLCVAHASSLALITLRLPGDQLATAGAF